MATGIVITAVDVDTGAEKTAPTGTTVSVTNSTASIVFTDAIQSNTRYFVNINQVVDTEGYTMQTPVKFNFTGPYDPLYITPAALVAGGDAFLSYFTEDQITFQLHRSSVFVNYLLMHPTPTNPGTGFTYTGEILDVYRVTQLNTTTMNDYVALHASYTLLQKLFYAIIVRAGDRKLDQLAVNYDGGLITALAAQIKQLKIDIKVAESYLFGGPAAPGIGVRSSMWNPNNMHSDRSVANLHRTNVGKSLNRNIFWPNQTLQVDHLTGFDPLSRIGSS